MKISLIILFILIFTHPIFGQTESDFLKNATLNEIKDYLNNNESFGIPVNTALFLAANLNGNDKAVLYLFDKYYLMDSLRYSDIELLLFTSIQKDNKKLFKKIITIPEFKENKAIDLMDYPIFIALRSHDDFYIKKLIQLGTNINIVSALKEKYTPLQYSIANNNYRKFKLLVSKGADIYEPYEKSQQSIIEFLFDKRRKHNQFHKIGLERYRTPFDDRITELLLKNYEIVYSPYEIMILLEYSIKTDNLKLFKQIVINLSKADLDYLDKPKSRLCYLAAEHNNSKYKNILRNLGLRCFD